MLFGYVNLYEEMLWLSTPPWTASSPAPDEARYKSIAPSLISKPSQVISGTGR